MFGEGKQSKFQRQSSNRYQRDIKVVPNGTSKNNWSLKHQEKGREAEAEDMAAEKWQWKKKAKAQKKLAKRSVKQKSHK